MDLTRSSAIAGAINTPPQKKSFHIQEVDNGFVLTFGFGFGNKIAKDKEEVLQFISEFIDLK